jgi:hypothetical protein
MHLLVLLNQENLVQTFCHINYIKHFAFLMVVVDLEWDQ